MRKKRTCITVSYEVREVLDKKKVHPRQTYEELLRILLQMPLQEHGGSIVTQTQEVASVEAVNQ